MSGYLKRTIDSVVEEHTEKLLDTGIIKEASHATPFIKSVLVHFHEDKGRFKFFLTFDPAPAIYEGQLQWNEELRMGKYLLPSLSFDSLRYNTVFCLPPFFDEMKPDEHLAGHMYRQLVFRLAKYDDNYAGLDLKEYIQRLNQFLFLNYEGEENSDTEHLLESFTGLETEIQSISRELGREDVLDALVKKLIQAGREFERFELRSKGLFDRLRSDALMSKNNQGKGFHSLPPYEQFMLRLYVEEGLLLLN